MNLFGKTIQYPLARMLSVLLMAMVLLGYPKDGWPTFPDPGIDPIPQATAETPMLVEAVMCEGIRSYAPWNVAVVFPFSVGTISCFTRFDPVPLKVPIYHEWYHRDQLVTQVRLILQPPKWSAYSSIRFREADKGPWQVKITDAEGRIFQVVHFSIVE